jgi:hypothetical protein
MGAGNAGVGEAIVLQRLLRKRSVLMVYLNEKAFALRPIRVDVKRNEFVNYEGTTFPRHPAAGCDMYLRRLAAFGCLLSKESFSPLAVDVLDAGGDILDTFPISKEGFEYLRRQLRFRRDTPQGGFNSLG